MRLALQQAQAAFDADEVPIGAVLVCDSQVVSTGQNATETRRNPLAHAELQCIMAAADSRRAWRLQDTALYCTVEPCPMCAGAILQARLQRLVYGARQPRLGADGSWVALFPPQPAAAEEGQQGEEQGELGARLYDVV
jgi:tRNA(adenine34) deaminase